MILLIGIIVVLLIIFTFAIYNSEDAIFGNEDIYEYVDNNTETYNGTGENHIGGKYEDIPMQLLDIIKPYLKEQGAEHFELYLEDYYDYSRSEIKKAKQKAKKLKDIAGKYSYIYYLLSDIYEDHLYDNVYEFMHEADIDYSAFVNEELKPYIIKSRGDYKVKDNTKIYNMFKKIGYTVTKPKIKKFLKKNKVFKLTSMVAKMPDKKQSAYLMKKSSYEPDMVGLISRGYNYFYDDTEDKIEEVIYPKLPKTKTIRKIYAPSGTMSFLDKLKYERKLLREAEQRRRDLERIQIENMNKQQRQELYDLRKKIENQQKIITNQEQEGRKKYEETKAEINKHDRIQEMGEDDVYRYQLELFRKALENDAELKQQAMDARANGTIREFMDRWLIENNLVYGMGQKNKYDNMDDMNGMNGMDDMDIVGNMEYELVPEWELMTELEETLNIK